MIEVLWNREVHYRRPSMDDPDIQEVLRLIERHKQIFGYSFYQVLQHLAPDNAAQQGNAADAPSKIFSEVDCATLGES